MFEKNSQISCQDHGFEGNIGSLNQQITHNRRNHEPNKIRRSARTPATTSYRAVSCWQRLHFSTGWRSMPYWKILMKWFLDNKIRVLKWLGNSPVMNPIEHLWDILKHEIHLEPINEQLTTKRELIKRLTKVWFYSEKITWCRKTLIESMPDKPKALKPYKEGQTKCWTTSNCDDNVLKVTLLVSQRLWSCFVSYIDYVNEKHVFLWKKIHNNFSSTVSIFKGEVKNDEISFYPLEIKKTIFRKMSNFRIQSPLSDAHCSTLINIAW